MYTENAKASFDSAQNLRKQKLQAGQFAFDVVQQQQQRLQDQQFQIELQRMRQRDERELLRFRTNEQIRLNESQPIQYDFQELDNGAIAVLNPATGETKFVTTGTINGGTILESQNTAQQVQLPNGLTLGVGDRVNDREITQL